MAEKRKKRLGDRFEGRRLRTISPYMAITPYIMKERSYACNMFSDTAEITEADRYLRRKRVEGMKGLGMLHLMTAAYIRAVSQYPSVNRFTVGRHVYARNDIIVIRTIKRTMEVDGEESSIKVHFKPDDTIFEVYEKMEAAIASIKNAEENGTDKLAGLLMKLPRCILNLAVSILKGMDYLWGLPKGIIEASPFHGSIVITDIGSLGIPPIHHHIYNFGNIPVFVGFGAKYRKYEPDKEGNIHERKYIDYNVVTDERITDGFNYASAFKVLRRYLAHPELLETPPEKVAEDID